MDNNQQDHGLCLQLQRQQQQQLQEAEEQEQQQQQLVLHGGLTRRIEYSASDMPPGYRFCPSDEVLIMSYLLRKIANLPLPVDVIHSVSLYGDSPDKLTSDHPCTKFFKENEWYFFTSRNRKYANGTRPDRSAGKGYWKPTGVERFVTVGRKTIGYKKALDYYKGRQPHGQRTDWKMHEYRIDQTGSAPNRNANGEMNMQLDECVLCRIYLSTRRRGDGEQEDAGESIMNADDDRGQTLQTNGAVVQIQNNNLVGSFPSIAHTFAWPLAYEPSSFQMFDQNSNFTDRSLCAGLNNSMFPAMASFPPTNSAAHVEPNYPILASSDFSDRCMYMKPINADIDEVDLADIMKDFNY